VKVLVVDDSRAMRMIVSRELRDLEAVHDVAEADSAEAAIDVLGTEPIDLVLCDWNMGGMTGLELLEALRAAGWAVPFGFVTSESSEAIVASALQAGAAFLLAKPFSGEELREKVSAVLAGEETTTSAPDQALDRTYALAQLLKGLLARPVSVTSSATGPTRQSPRCTATYVDSAGTTVAYCIVEAPLASAMSAALTMLPASLAAQWAGAGALPDVLSENFHEVTNVLAKLVHARGERCVLGGTAGFAPGEQLPQIDQINAASCNESFEVAIDGYGEGLLSLVTL
jgi:two-component system chemotaxis response regulator CheY